jgi:hypothetical protein
MKLVPELWVGPLSGFVPYDAQQKGQLQMKLPFPLLSQATVLQTKV